MKGAVEYFVVMLLVMFSILLIFNFIGVLYQIHTAHNYRDKVVSLIENYEGDTWQVTRAMNDDKRCSSCSYRSFLRDRRITVTVYYEIEIKMLNFIKNVELLGMTQIGGDGRLSFLFGWKYLLI